MFHLKNNELNLFSALSSAVLMYICIVSYEYEIIDG